MANTDIALKEAMTIDGALGAALVDLASGMSLGVLGGTSELDPAVAAAGHTDLVRAKQRTMQMLGVDGQIEDILITLTRQYHLIRPLTAKTGAGLFLVLILDRQRANLAMARRRLQLIEGELDL
ncbi:hypothetical protein [Streptacidiphilus jiangxiensis]|uniref:Roadblock/LAMTOR2 domain-containing protein n=1 Tax=Streptacidiphilus jiangxiensis TaxID=235985 RepID=A0A1H7WQ66_STRJI|nr:hypothetical protein [Streptacidiphilus jiangxiensis]SEM23642.1 hypothetical protein SAMN05414137_12152 [Streptacidiphilus jiangxiensis]